MLEAFLKYGDFEEVVIPSKRDKRGMRFRFARAIDVRDPDRFAIKLDNIIIGSEKIYVNIPRFLRDIRSTPLVTPTRKNAIYRPHPYDHNLVYPKFSKHPYSSKTSDQRYQTRDQKHQTSRGNLTILPQNNMDSATNKYKPKTVIHSQPNRPLDLPVPHSPSVKVGPAQNLNYKPPSRPRRPWAHRHFSVDEPEVLKISEAYVGVAKKPGLSYKIQEEFIQQGYF